MTRVCFENGIGFKALIISEFLQLIMLIFGFIYDDALIFTIGILISIVDFTLFVIWMNNLKGWSK